MFLPFPPALSGEGGTEWFSGRGRRRKQLPRFPEAGFDRALHGWGVIRVARDGFERGILEGADINEVGAAG